MSGVAYIRLFGDDWLSGTQELSLEERGALITIVALTSTTGKPPALDYDRLCRRFGETKHSTKKLIKALVDLEKIYIEDECIFNERAIKETKISQKKSEKQSDIASKRWSKDNKKPKENNASDDAMAMPEHMPRRCQPEPEPEPKNIKTNFSSKTVDSIKFDPRDVFNSGDYVFDPNRWFTENEIEILEDKHLKINVRGKLSDKTFQDWAFRADFQNPLSPARKWFEKQEREEAANNSLIENYQTSKNMEIGEASHLIAALDRKAVI